MTFLQFLFWGGGGGRLLYSHNPVYGAKAPFFRNNSDPLILALVCCVQKYGLDVYK